MSGSDMPEEDSRNQSFPDQNSKNDNEHCDASALSSNGLIEVASETSYSSNYEYIDVENSVAESVNELSRGQVNDDNAEQAENGEEEVNDPNGGNGEKEEEKPNYAIQWFYLFCERSDLEAEISENIKEKCNKRMLKRLNIIPINEGIRSNKPKTSKGQKFNDLKQANLRWIKMKQKKKRVEKNLSPKEVPKMDQQTVERNNDQERPSKKMKLSSPMPSEDSPSVSGEIIENGPKKLELRPLRLSDFKETPLLSKFTRYEEIVEAMSKLVSNGDLNIE